MRQLGIVFTTIWALALPLSSAAEGIRTIIVTDPPLAASSGDTLESDTQPAALEEPVTLDDFTDIDQDQWYALYVQAMLGWRLASGYRDAEGKPMNRFGPGDPVTVAQLLKMALNGAKADLDACGRFPSSAFTDHWAAEYVACGQSMGFRIFRRQVDIDRPVLRGEALGIIHDALKAVLPDLPSPFLDTEAHPYKRDIAYDAARQIVSGIADASGHPTGYFQPNTPLTRAEISKILYLTLVADDTSPQFPPSMSVELDARNYAFEPATITVKKGIPVILKVQNEGHHSFVLEAMDIEEELEEAETTITFTPVKAGSFPFSCGMPGHADAGMVGTLVVQ